MLARVAEGTFLEGLFETERSDNWWAAPLLTALGFGGFIVYTTFRVFYNNYYIISSATSAEILSPFYSPLLLRDGPRWLSPAIFILWVPAGFRLTCYYYRKAYYRAYLVDPPGCAVGEPARRYGGETGLFLFQNLHRYMMYFAMLLLVILAMDVVYACIWPTEDGGHGFGVSVATVVMAINVTLLAFYSFGCHSFRHIVGGRLNRFTHSASGHLRLQAWRAVTRFNEHHMLWAWTSLFTVAFTDFYIWMVSAGIWTDFRII